MLKISQLNAGYEDLQVLKDASLELPAGKIGVLMGPNGAGKSTLLKSIFNLVKVTSGSIQFSGEELVGLPTHSLLLKAIAYVPQGKINFSTLTVQENLNISFLPLTKGESAARRQEGVYSQFPVLKDRRREFAFKLSGGQQQMLALGRAIMTTPKLLLLDEPSLGLSPKLVKEVFAKVHEINEKFGTTTLIVEHNIKSVLDIAHMGYIMVGGQVIAAAAAENLKQSPVLQKVFVGEFE